MLQLILFSALNLSNLQGNEEMQGPNNICDLNQIYNDQYSFSLPRADLEKQLSGVAFDHKTPYTQEELEALSADINEIYQRILAANPVRGKVAVITAGGPGAGKTTKLEQDLEARGEGYGYTDPDAVCLKSMSRTYKADITEGMNWKEAYEKWRPGSNAANNLILGNLIREGYNFYFGTTATSPHTWRFLDFLKKNGYQIRIIHVSATDKVRWESIQERDKTFIQTTEADTAQKGLMFPERIADTYLKYADQIDFCWRDGVHEDAVLAATWEKKRHVLEVLQPDAYDKIKDLHNQMVEKKPELAWEKTVELN